MARPLCRYCGKVIARKTVSVHFSQKEREAPDAPRTKESAQRRFNELIVHIQTETVGGQKRIVRADLWDGETYRDKHFCKDSCAQFFGRTIAEHDKTLSTKRYFEALEKQKAKTDAHE